MPDSGTDYDIGGQAPPPGTLMTHHGPPEPVLTAEQWAELDDETAELYALDPWPPYAGDDLPPTGGDNTVISGDDLCAWVRERSEDVMIGMSFGKDSLTAFEQLTRFWPRERIHGFNLYLAPGLELQRRNLDYYSRELGIDIHSHPNRSLYLMIREGTFQPPSHLPVIIGLDWPDVTFPAIYSSIADAAGVDPDTTWVATGVRAADSPMRRVSITQHGPFNLENRSFFPVWDRKKADVLAAISRLGVKLPVDYRIWGRTFDGLDHRFTKGLAEHFPADYRALLELYPLMGAEYIRHGERPPMERE